MIRPRTLARRLALQYCFMCDLNDEWDTQLLAEFLAEHGEDEQSRAFAAELVGQVLVGRERADELLRQTADNWSLQRIAPVERNILRVACVEFFGGAAPVPVIINEAVSLAKKFGSKDSSRFVNGILDRIARKLREGADV